MQMLQGFDAAAIANTPFGRGEQDNVTALATYVAAASRGLRFNLPQSHAEERRMYEIGKRVFYFRGGPYDFSCASCHGEDGKRIRLQDLPNLTKNPGDGVGFAAWPAYRVSNGQMWGMQLRLNDCYRQQRFPYPGFGSEATVALGVLHGRQRQGRRVDRAVDQALRRQMNTAMKLDTVGCWHAVLTGCASAPSPAELNQQALTSPSSHRFATRALPKSIASTRTSASKPARAPPPPSPEVAKRIEERGVGRRSAGPRAAVTSAIGARARSSRKTVAA